MVDQSVKEFFNKSADQYRSDLKAGAASTVDFVGERANAGDRLLDIGCGSGAFTQAVREQTTVNETVGIDIARNMLPDSDTEGNYSLADAGHLPFEDESFEFVHIDTVLHHVVESSRASSKRAVRGVLFEVDRVLKPKQYVVLTERLQIGRFLPDKALAHLIFWGLKFAAPLIAVSGENAKSGQPPICFYTEDELLELTGRAGFLLEDVNRIREHEFLPLRRVFQKESQRVTLFLRKE